jgi:hypothetical protein
VTPAVDASEPLFDFGKTPAETLEGVGVPPVSAESPRASEPPQSLGVPVEPSRLPTIRPREREERKRRERAGDRESSWVAVLFRTLLAGAVAFGVTSWLVLPLFSNGEQRDTPAAEPAAASSAPAVPPAAPGPKVALRSEELEVPGGIELAPGRGLLEIETSGPEAFFIDNAFVGRGPTRRVELPAGPHSVEVRDDGQSSKIEVTLVAGRRVRILPAGEAPATGPAR